MGTRHGAQSGHWSGQGFKHMLSITPPRPDVDAFGGMTNHVNADALVVASINAGYLTAGLESLPQASPNEQLWSAAESASTQVDDYPQSVGTSVYQNAQYHIHPESSPPESSTQHAASNGSEEQTQFICWDHGCQGRVFTTYSNLRRHCREQSETPEKTTCEGCGRQFSRPAAKTRHQDRGRCKRPAITGHYAPVLLSRGCAAPAL
jgi:hypothetical protein